MNKELKNLLQEKTIPIIFDYDGVLFEARFLRERCLTPNEKDSDFRLELVKQGKYLCTKPISIMKDIVENIKGDIYVCSHIWNNIEYNYKCSAIENIYNIPRENLYYAKSRQDKIPFLETIYKNYDSFVYIDDTLPYIREFEEYFYDKKGHSTDKVHFYHVSSLFA